MDVLDRLRGGLVASCQPVDGGPMDRPDIVAAMAEACVAGGAAGLRIEGVENLRAVRSKVAVPLIGLVKSDVPGSSVRITARVSEVQSLIAAGADIVAYDGTDRLRADSRESILEAIRAAGIPAMADCSSLADAKAALAGGAAVIGTTLSGYTGPAAPPLEPDLELVRAFARLGPFVMAEGRYNTPELAARALAAGAGAVTVGSALTRLEHVTGWFTEAVKSARRETLQEGFSVDIGGTKIAVAWIEGGRIARRLQAPTETASCLDGVLDQVGQLLDRIGFSGDSSLGLAVTGRLGPDGTWSAVNAGTLPQIAEAPLALRATKRFGPVRVGNDAVAAALAEARLGAGIGADAFAYLTVSTGVGGGFVLQGQPVQGGAGLAGHVGFMSSPHADERCGSGRFGTVESVAGGRAIAEAAARVGYHYDARDVFAAAGDGAGWAVAIVDRAARAIATLLGDLRSGFGIERAAIGGSIGLAPGFRDRVEAHLQAEPSLFRPSLVSASLGQDSALLGALMLPLSEARS